MSRLAHHFLALAVLIAGCFGGCNLIPSELQNPPAAQIEPNDAPDSGGSETNDSGGTGGSGSGDAGGAPPGNPDGDSGGNGDGALVPPPPPMPPGAWEVDRLPGIRSETVRRWDYENNTWYDVVTETPVESNVGVLFGSDGQLLAIRALGATGYVPLVHVGNELRGLDSWTDARGLAPVSWRVTAQIATEEPGHVHIELRGGGPLPEGHAYDILKEGDAVRIAATIGIRGYPENFQGHITTSVFNGTLAHRVPDAPAPFVGAWTIGAEPPQQNGEPGFSFFYDQLGRLSSASFGSVDRWLGSPGVSAIATVGSSAASPFAILRSERALGSTRDILEATLEIENRSVGTYSMRHRIIETADDGTETVILDEQSGLTREITRRISPPAPPATISTADVPGAVPALAGAWEGEIEGELQGSGDPPQTAVRRVGIEFDAVGRFNRVRLPQSTGYLSRPAAATYEYSFLAPQSLEYRTNGARLVMVEHERSTTDRREYITATYDIDIAVTPEGVRVHYVEERVDLIHDDSTFRFEGVGLVGQRTGPLPVALTGRWDIEIMGTQQGWTRACDSPIVEVPPEAAARNTYLVFDNAGRLTLGLAVSYFGAGAFYGWDGTGFEVAFSPGRVDNATEWGISYSAAFWRDHQPSNHDRTRLECDQDCIVEQSTGIPMLRVDVTDRGFRETSSHCPFMQNTYIHFTGSGETTPADD